VKTASCAGVDGGTVVGSRSRICSADLVHTNSSGISFQVAAQSKMSAVSSLTLRCAERFSFLVVRAENHRSTRFIHEP
jgi:hypothetical protein